MHGFAPRMSAYLVSLDLSEFLGSAVAPVHRTPALAKFAADEWRVVGLLDRLANARTSRGVPAARVEVQALRDALLRVGLPLPDMHFADGMLREILAELDED